jgi:cobalt-zinc-cadmium efflux system outer membrane protein
VGPGATVTVPIFDRNQGNIRRSQVNVEQSQYELRALEQRVTAEVENAYDDYISTQIALRQIETELLPDIEKTMGQSIEQFRKGTLDASSYLSARRDLDDLGRQYRELLIRHRRSMLAMNTAIGMRVFP